MTVAEHIRILHEALRAEHEEWIAKIQSWADEAAARGDTKREREHLEHIARLEAIPKPWETYEPRTAA